jgi:tetratricopeptide (TPR) repeat protein
VVAKLKVSLLGGMPKVRQTDPRAYDLFLQSNEVVRQSLPDRYERNLALMNQALAIDPNYVAAWTRIAVVHANQASQGIDASKSPEEEFKLAREAANKALAIDPTYVWIYPALAQIAMLANLDFAAAARYLEHALALEPGNAELMNPAAVLVQNLGRLKEAAELREFVIARDPVNAAAHFNLGLTYHYMGRPDDAIAAARRSLTIAPKRVVAHYVIALAMLDKNDPQGALLEIQQEPSVGWREIGLPLVYHALGKKRESDEALASLIATRERDSAFNIASAFAFRGETDRAFEWLDKAFANHDSGISIASFEPLLKNLHSDPRWLPFLRKVGKAPEQLAAIKFDVTIPKI